MAMETTDLASEATTAIGIILAPRGNFLALCLV